MKDENGLGESARDLSPVALYVARLERRISPVIEDDVENGFNAEDTVNCDAVLKILNSATDENARAIARKFYDVFFAEPLDPWLKSMRN